MSKLASGVYATVIIGLLNVSACANSPLTINPVNTAALRQQTPGTRVDVLYAQGRDALIAGDLAAALELFHGARRAGPDDIRVLNGLAVIYDRLGRYDLSAIYYDSARDLDPNSTVLQANLALSNQMRTRQTPQLSQATTQTAALAPASIVTLAKPDWEEPPAPSEANVPTRLVAPPAPRPTGEASIAYDPSNANPILAQRHDQLALTVAPQPVILDAAVPSRRPRSSQQIAPHPSALPAPALKPSWSRSAVIVINGSGVRGQARLTATHLRETGFVVLRIGNELPFERANTLIIYGSGQRQQALRISQTIRGQLGAAPKMVAVLGNSQIQVRLGRDTITPARSTRRHS